jgi:8-oxo-dGTP pyrophosphatase MutT (NUDIX family)
MQKRAGSLVVNRNKELLLIYRKGKWDLPKGKVEKSEKKKTWRTQRDGRRNWP